MRHQKMRTEMKEQLLKHIKTKKKTGNSKGSCRERSEILVPRFDFNLTLCACITTTLSLPPFVAWPIEVFHFRTKKRKRKPKHQ